VGPRDGEDIRFLLLDAHIQVHKHSHRLPYVCHSGGHGKCPEGDRLRLPEGESNSALCCQALSMVCGFHCALRQEYF
jgi:hypothetical protein